MLRKLIISFICMSLLVPMFGINRAEAVSFNPTRIELQADPGDVFTGVFTLFSDSEEEVVLEPKISDFTSSNDEKGIPDFNVPEDYAFGLSSWISFDSETITVPAGEKVEVNYTVTVPSDAIPGGHYGAILFPTNTTSDIATEVGEGDEGTVAIRGFSGPLMILQVNGDITESANFLEFSRDKKWYSSLPVNMFLRMENTGNNHLKPVGYIYVKDMFGRTVAVLNVNDAGGNVLPDSIRRFDNTWEKVQLEESVPELVKEIRNFGIGKYTAQLNLTYGVANQSLDLYQSFWVFPWQLILIVVGVLIVILGFFKLYNRSVIKHTMKKMDKENKKEDKK